MTEGDSAAQLVEARRAIRVIERYLYSVLGKAEEGSEDAKRAQNVKRLAVGLRRKLDAEETQ